MNPHAISDPMSCPTGHQTESMVRRLPDANGRNSRNKAPSTGRLPPTPNPRAANNPHVAIQLVAPPIAMPKTPQIKRLKLKAGRRPMISDAIPQKEAPQQRPTNVAHVVYLMVMLSTPNSGLNFGKHKARPWSQRLALSAYEHLSLIFLILLVSKPAKSAQTKKLPLVFPHTNILYCSVDDFRFALIEWSAQVE